MRRIDWVTKKKEIALNLANGECGGSYAEAMLILCSALSALAAEVWPGKRIDQKRFVELLKEYSPPDLNATDISIPILVWHLKKAGMSAETKQIKEAFLSFPYTQVLTGNDVDRAENEILLVCNTISIKDIRDCSYANLLYREVRSSYTHEYQVGDRADPWQMTRKSEVNVSYVNWVDDPDRHIHFHVGWVAELAVSTAQKLDKIMSPITRNQPAKWWIEG